MNSLKSKGMLTLSFFLITTFIFRKFQGGFVSGFLFYMILSLFIFELLLILGSSGGIRVNRKLDKIRLTAKESLTVHIDVSFPRLLLFMWVSIEDHLPGKLHQRTKEIVYWKLVGAKRGIEFTYQIKQMPRGEYAFRDITIRMGDFFGFFQREFKVAIPESVLVYPSYQFIRSFHSINEKNIGTMYTLNRHAEDVTSVMGIRDYVYGDRLSRIHWKASARTGQLKTKEFEYHVTNDFMFYIDCELRSYRESLELFERGIEVCASLIKYALDNRFTVGLSAYRRKPIIIPMARNQDHLLRIFEQLSRLEADSTFSFAKFLLKQAVLLPYGTTLMIITGKLDRPLLEVLSELKIRNISVELFWVVNRVQAGGELLNAFSKEGISVHIIDRDDIAATLGGGRISGKIS